MDKNTDYKRKQEELSWLENLQRNSWEPEVIISGITLAFLFIFPAKIYSLSAYMIQELGITYLPSFMILIYLTAIITVFKIFFVIHLVLRFIWTGLLGLSYSYPNGVIHANLFRIAKGYNYQKPAEMVLKLEKVCSMTFAYPVSLVLILLIITLYLGFLIAIYLWLELNLFIISIILLITLAGFILFILSHRKNKFKSWYSESLLNSVSAIYQSNIGKWSTVFYGVFIIFLASPVIITDMTDFSMYRNENALKTRILEWPAKQLHYENEHDPSIRFPRGFISQEEISEDFLRLGIARYEEDSKIIRELKNKFTEDLLELNWRKLNETADLHRIYIDEQPVSVKKWSKHRLKVNHQKIYQTSIDTRALSEGVHTIRIEKLILSYGFFDNKPTIKVIDKWSSFEFIKR